MANKYFNGVIENKNVSEDVDQELIQLAIETPIKVQAKMEELRVADAIDEIFKLLRRTNKYIDETMPWALAKDETKQDRLATVLYHLAESIRFSAVCLKAFLPSTATKILTQINCELDTLQSLQTFGDMFL